MDLGGVVTRLTFKMEIKVIEQYTDKHTGAIHRPGEVLEVSEARASELIGKGKVELIQKEQKSTGKTKELKSKIKTK